MRKKLFITLSVILTISACQSTKNNQNTDLLSGSRSQLLENITNNIIIPAFDNLQNNLTNLNSTAQEFINNPTTLKLDQLRNAWKNAYLSWQSVEMFSLGKAEEIEYVKSMNTYPCNTIRIDNNIENQTYDLSQSNYLVWATQGFPALDYMLYGLDADTNMIINYYTGNNSTKYLDYLNSVINQMQTNTYLVTEYWNANKNNFINSNGNTASSSLNVLTNDFIYYYEKGLRANKIGIPCGVWDGFQTYEIGVEAYYSKYFSKRLALEALNACKDFFTGKAFNTTETGFSYEDLLSENGDGNLSTDIINALNQAEIEINSLNNNFRLQLVEDNNSMLSTYDALQSVVPLLKVNMLYSLNITVDYADSDGD